MRIWAGFLGTSCDAVALKVLFGMVKNVQQIIARGAQFMHACILQDLAGREAHPAFVDLAGSCSLLDTHLLTCLERTLSALARWRPELAASYLLPAAVFPFVLSFGEDPMACLQACTTTPNQSCMTFAAP
jgi:hypothetical protein